MEDVLDLYAEPYDPQRPVVCFDESPVQLVSETGSPLPVRPERIERYDYEYKREGTANLFLFVQPLLSSASSQCHDAPYQARLCTANETAGRCLFARCERDPARGG